METTLPGRASWQPLARVILEQEVLVGHSAVTGDHRLEESGNGQKETGRPVHTSNRPPRVLLAGIRLG